MKSPHTPWYAPWYARLSTMQSSAVYLAALAAFLLVALLFSVTAGADGTDADRPDAMISAEVRVALVTDPALSTMDITVETRERVVQLRGFVNTTEEISKAGELASMVSGVTSVKNAIRVSDRPSRA